MAQIRVVEKKGGLAWLWSLIALLIAAALVWYFLSDRRIGASSGEVAPPPAQQRDSALLPRALEPMPGTLTRDRSPRSGDMLAAGRAAA